MRIAEDIVQVRSPGVCSYVIRAGDELFLIDGGFIGGRFCLRRELERSEWCALPLRGVLLTHGHLDHTFNLSWLQGERGVWVAAPKADEAHIKGTFPYQGISRICGALEWLGRTVLRYRPCKPDRWIEDGNRFPILGGVTAVSLPGHTVGHLGFYSPSRRLLFSGDLFASHRLVTCLPPRFLNTSQTDLYRSVERVLDMDLEGVLPNHGGVNTPAGYLERLRELAIRKGLGCAHHRDLTNGG